VTFCDLSARPRCRRGSIPGSRSEVIGAYRRCAAETVGRFGGFGARSGVPVYLGYPQAT
jgi:hypothetical protein